MVPKDQKDESGAAAAEEEKKLIGQKPSTTGLARPQTAVTKPTSDDKKPTGVSKGADAGAKKPAGKDDDSNDPIAAAMALRIKAGGPTSVVSASDAKKGGAGNKETVKVGEKPEKVRP